MHVTSSGRKKIKIQNVKYGFYWTCATWHRYRESKLRTAVSQGPSILLYLNHLYHILYSLITVVYFAFVSSLKSCHSRNLCLSGAFEMFVQGNACLFLSGLDSELYYSGNMVVLETENNPGGNCWLGRGRHC